MKREKKKKKKNLMEPYSSKLKIRPCIYYLFKRSSLCIMPLNINKPKAIALVLFSTPCSIGNVSLNIPEVLNSQKKPLDLVILTFFSIKMHSYLLKFLFYPQFSNFYCWLKRGMRVE